MKNANEGENNTEKQDQPKNEKAESDSKPTVIAKITKDSEFSYVCNQLREQTGKAEKWEIDQLKQKIEIYIRKQLTDLTNTSKKTSAERKELRRHLLDFVMLVDNFLPWEEFFRDHGMDIFAMFFKLTTYAPNILYSVLNQNTDTLDVETHDVLCVTVLNHIKLIDS